MAANSLTNYHPPPIIGVWVDQNMDQPHAHSKMKQDLRQLSKLIEGWKYYYKPEEFYQFLDDDPKNNIFLITSGSMAQQIVPIKHDYANIHSIYIFCHDVTQHRQLKAAHQKVKDAMNLEKDAKERIADELSLLLIETGEAYIESNDRALARNNLEEALRLMRENLRWPNDHGRIQKANDLLHRLETWNEDILNARNLE